MKTLPKIIIGVNCAIIAFNVLIAWTIAGYSTVHNFIASVAITIAILAGILTMITWELNK